MVVQRSVSKGKYVIAGVLTLLLFLLGVTLGMLIDSERLRWLEQTSKEQELELRSAQFQLLYMTTIRDEERSCPVLQTTLKRAVRDLSQSLDRIQQFKEDTTLNDNAYRIVARRYLLDNLNYWLLAREGKKRCGLDAANLIYFFHDDCDVCPIQGVLLTYFKNVFNDRLLIFPLDASLAEDEPALDVLLNAFNVTEYPTLIVGDRVFKGLIEERQLQSIICSQFKNESAC